MRGGDPGLRRPWAAVLMVIDTLALVAMLADESMRMMSTASYVETAIVIGSRFDESGGRELDLWPTDRVAAQ